jgi:hypothetical protein
LNQLTFAKRPSLGSALSVTIEETAKSASFDSLSKSVFLYASRSTLLLFWKSADTQAGRMLRQPSRTFTVTSLSLRFIISALRTRPYFAEEVQP